MQKNFTGLQRREWKKTRNAIIMAAGMSSRFAPFELCPRLNAPGRMDEAALSVERF